MIEEMRTASLPMYDLLEVRPALDAIWADLAMRLTRMGVREVPAALMHGRPLSELWPDPRLLLSQCCGPDLFTAAGAQLVVIGRPVFADLVCEPGTYFSQIVASSIAPPTSPRIAITYSERISPARD